jgi:hypothetical protein
MRPRSRLITRRHAGRLSGLIACVTTLALAPPAAAGGVLTLDDRTLRYVASDTVVNASNRVIVGEKFTQTVFPPVTQRWITVTSTNDSVDISAIAPSTCQSFEVGLHAAAMCKDESVARLIVELGAGDDIASNADSLPATLNGGPGDDRLAGESQRLKLAETLDGGPGDDDLDGGNGADTLRGGAGDDQLLPGIMPEFAFFARMPDDTQDEVSGGDGIDTLRYGYDLVGVRVALDAVADDGWRGNGVTPPENDRILPDVENVEGTTRDDTLIGAGGVRNELAGDAGNDTITASDNGPDVVRCGAGEDTTTVDDTLDTTVECEHVTRVLPDADGDGYRRGEDCDDANAAINPQAVDVLDNEIDEDCDGVAANDPDRDRDGVRASRDCDDGDSRRHPGALDRLDNDLDENCDGIAERYLAPTAGIRWRSQTSIVAGWTRFASLIVRGLHPGDAVTLSCRGRGCIRRLTATLPVRRSRPLDLSQRARTARLRKKALLGITVSAPNRIAKRWVFTARLSRSGPALEVRCKAPSATRWTRCR